jgi:uncharacterized protein (DUF427 family)
MPMNPRMKIPGPDHPISITKNPQRVRVTFAGKVVADTTRALEMREASYPPVQYVPREDVDAALMTRTAHASYCPYKGDCSYFSINVGGQVAENAIWSYEDPYAAVAEIKEYVAFYPSRVDAIEQSPA